MSKLALILGAGPSGLMAAHAAETMGYEVYLHDARVERPDGRTSGVFYLHDSCGLDVPSTLVDTYAVGSRSGYAAKVYGADYTGHVSFPEAPRQDRVFDGMAALDLLWKRFSGIIFRDTINSLDDVREYARYNEVVISTVPLDCYVARSVILPHTVVYVSTRQYPDAGKGSYVLYNGDETVDWYRESVVFGRKAIEWRPGFDLKHRSAPDWINRPVRKVQSLAEPLDLRLPDNVLLTGRYGAWDKKILTHDVFRLVREWLDER